MKNKAIRLISLICAFALAFPAVTITAAADGMPITRMEISAGDLNGSIQDINISMGAPSRVEVDSIQIIIQRQNLDIIKIKSIAGPFIVDGEQRIILKLDMRGIGRDEYAVTAIAKDSDGKDMSGAFPVLMVIGIEGETTSAPLISRVNLTSRRMQMFYTQQDCIVYLSAGCEDKPGNVLSLKKGSLVTVQGNMADEVTQIKCGNIVAFMRTEDAKKIFKTYDYYPFYYQRNQEQMVDYVLNQLGKNLQNCDDIALRRNVVTIALSQIGRIPYFWGGKYDKVGVNPSWGTPRKVTSGNSKTTGTIRPYGLDCSGYVQWVFVNALYSVGVKNPKFRTGTSNQWKISAPVLGGKSIEYYLSKPHSADDPQRPMIGDIALTHAPDGSGNHVGIVVGYTDAGKILVAHCSSSRGGTVITESKAGALHYVRRPYVYDDYNYVDMSPEIDDYDYDGSGENGDLSGATDEVPPPFSVR